MTIPLSIAVVGCGDVLFRSYLPALESAQDRVSVLACCDPDQRRAQMAASRCTAWPRVRVHETLEAAVDDCGDELDAVINLTPVRSHFEVTSQALDASLHVYSEKPIATDVSHGRALAQTARDRQLVLLCAPAVLVTARFRWLSEALSSGRIGRPTLAVAQASTLGPASLRGYEGDPRPYYSRSVGPLVDIGIYLLHAVTGLFGPAKRLQAFGGIAIPERVQANGASPGAALTVEANDHILLHLDFGAATFAQILASYAVPGTQQPTLELHGTQGSLSFPRALPPNGQVHLFSGPLDFFATDNTPLGLEAWARDVAPHGRIESAPELIGSGPDHFARCLREGAAPILTAEHACHVLEIIDKTQQSIQTGRALTLDSSFEVAPRGGR